MKVFLSTSGYSFDGHKIKQYLGYCSVDYAVDMDLTFETLESRLASAKTKVLGKIEQSASESGANALIGLNVNYTVFTPELVVVEARGTAVVIQAETGGRIGAIQMTERPRMVKTSQPAAVPQTAKEVLPVLDPIPPKPDHGHIEREITAVISAPKNDPADTVWFYDSEEHVGVSGREALAEEPEFCYSIKDVLEDEPESVYRKLLIAVEEMESAREIGAYIKGFSVEHGCCIDMQLLKDIRDSVLIEQRYGNQKSYLVNKIKEYIFEEE